MEDRAFIEEKELDALLYPQVGFRQGILDIDSSESILALDNAIEKLIMDLIGSGATRMVCVMVIDSMFPCVNVNGEQVDKMDRVEKVEVITATIKRVFALAAIYRCYRDKDEKVKTEDGNDE